MSAPDGSAACETLLRKPAVAQALGVGVRTLERMLSARAFPGPDITIGSRLLLWRPATVQGWIDNEARRQARGGAR